MPKHLADKESVNRHVSAGLAELHKSWSQITTSGTATEFDNSYVGKHRPGFWEGHPLLEGSKYWWHATPRRNLTDHPENL